MCRWRCCAASFRTRAPWGQYVIALAEEHNPPVHQPSGPKPGILFLLTAHHPPNQLNRTLHFRVGRRSLYLCTRCLGKWLGLPLALCWGLAATQGEGSLVAELLVLALLPLPVAIDWSTQTLGYREGRNLVRIITGFLYGVALGRYATHWLRADWPAAGLGSLILLVYFLVFCFVISRPGVAAGYLAPYERFIAQHFGEQGPILSVPSAVTDRHRGGAVKE